MRYIKKYENYKDEPQIGDYVILYNDVFDSDIIEFLKTEIGKIIDIQKGSSTEYPYLIEFEKEIPIYNDNRMYAERDEIVKWAYDKEILEIKDTINNYNL